MTRVVLTSFEPFGGHSVNSSLEVGRAIARRPPPGVDLHWMVLPVEAGTCVEQAWDCIRQVEPSLVLSLGQAAGATSLRIESVAVNWNDFGITDNAGNRPRKQPIVPDGPALHRGTVRPRTLRQILRSGGIPAELSDSAGTYVCNHLYYGLLHRAGAAGYAHQTGFIHLPLLPGQVGRRPSPSRSLEQMAEGIRLAITACVEAGRTRKPGCTRPADHVSDSLSSLARRGDRSSRCTRRP
jgi:pyroglutamyl-peptidase